MANNTLIGAIRAEATLEGGKFVDGAKKIRKEAKATEVQVKSSFSAMGAAVKGFGGALTAGLSIGLLGGLAKKALDYATSIKDVAAQVGVTTKALQEFRYAASQVGIKQAEADKGLEKLNLTLGKAAAGSASAQKALAAVGVTMADVRSKAPTEVFAKMADQINKQGGAAKNAAPLNAVLGESYAKLNPLVEQGSKGLDELAQAANRLGVVLSDSAIQSADETARKLDDVRQVLAAQIAGVVAENAGSIVTLAQALSTLTSEIIKFMGSNPQAALAIIGALAGSRFGLPGAAAGAVAGAYAGSGLQDAADTRKLQSNTALLRHNTKQAADAIRAKRAAGQPIKQSELNRLQSLTNKLNAATGRGPSVSFGAGDVPQFLASAPKAGRKARTPRAPRDRSDDVTFQFDQELRRAELDVLRAQQSMARTHDERARLALEILDAEKQMQNAELDNRVRRAERDFAEGKITESALEQAKVQADNLRLEYDKRDALERQAVADQLAADKARDAAVLADGVYDHRIEMLQLEGVLADTAAERRDVELRILAAMKEQEKARLEAVIADTESSELAKEEARRRLAQLDEVYEARRRGAEAANRSPMDEYKARYADITEENEQAIVNGLEDMADALSKVTEGWDEFKEAALSALKTVFQTILKNQINQLFASLLPSGGLNFGNLFGGGISGSTSSSPPIFSPGNPGVGFHNGGSLTLRGIPGVDKNIISMNGIPIARADYGERLHFQPANDRGGTSGSRIASQTINVYANDADSFRRNERQIARDAKRRLALG